MNKSIMLAVPALALVATNVTASESSPIIVTATRTAQTADETLSSVTVITREQIQQQQARSVQDLLRGVAGISITNNGGQGKATSMFIRGTESDHILVLIDGIKAGSATLGTTAFQLIPVDQIERIEIVRGPHSALYGSEAIGGVIQIFTRKGGGKLTPSFSYEAGTYNTYKLTTGVSGGGDKGWFSFNASSLNTDGFNACRGTASAGCFTTEPDKDGFEQGSATIRSGYRFDQQTEVDFHWLRAESEEEFDGSSQNESESVQNIIGATVRFSPVDIWAASLTLGQSRDESENFKDGTFSSRFITKRDSLSFQNDLSISTHHVITAGVDAINDQVESTTNYTEDSRHNIGVFAQYQVDFGAHDLQLNLRADDNEQFGNNTTGMAAWGMTTASKLRFTLSAGNAFKAPTFNELYFPGFGNANLKPEKSESIEFGISQARTSYRWNMNLYHTTIDELIGFDASFNPVNIDEARINGLEAGLQVNLSQWEINTVATLLDAQNRSAGTNYGNELPRRASETLRIDADYTQGDYRYGVTFYGVGQRYDNLANTRKLAGYATVDVRAQYAFEQDWLAQVRIANLFDKQYETAEYYNQEGVSLYLSLTYQPK